jgi:hypothetical protein
VKRPSKRAARFRFRSRLLRTVIWIFLIVFVFTSVGLLVITTARR